MGEVIKIKLSCEDKAAFLKALSWLKKIEETQKVEKKYFLGISFLGYCIPLTNDNLKKIETLRQNVKIYHDNGHVSFSPISNFLTIGSENIHFIERVSRDLPKSLDDIYKFYEL